MSGGTLALDGVSVVGVYRGLVSAMAHALVQALAQEMMCRVFCQRIPPAAESLREQGVTRALWSEGVEGLFVRVDRDLPDVTSDWRRSCLRQRLRSSSSSLLFSRQPSSAAAGPRFSRLRKSLRSSTSGSGPCSILVCE